MKTLMAFLVAGMLLVGEASASFIADSLRGKTTWSEEEIACLTATIYHEARGEPMAGQIAVAEVVMARVNSSRFPSTICEVVNQPWQFSWLFEATDIDMEDRGAYVRAEAIAYGTVAGMYKSSCAGANHFHGHSVSPSWSYGIDACVINGHAFFRL